MTPSPPPVPFASIERFEIAKPWSFRGGALALTKNIDPTNVADLTWAEIACREKIHEVMREHCKTHPGLEKAFISQIAPQLDITESRRLIGRRVLTPDDANKHFSDAIGVTGNWSKYREFYEIPYSCLLVSEFDNLLAAGRCISVNHRASTIRPKKFPPASSLEKPPGLPRALAVQQGIAPAALDVNQLRSQLIRQGACLAVPSGSREESNVRGS